MAKMNTDFYLYVGFCFLPMLLCVVQHSELLL